MLRDVRIPETVGESVGATGKLTGSSWRWKSRRGLGCQDADLIRFYVWISAKRLQMIVADPLALPPSSSFSGLWFSSGLLCLLTYPYGGGDFRVLAEAAAAFSGSRTSLVPATQAGEKKTIL